MVSRVGDRFRVTVPTLAGEAAEFFVKRGDAGEIGCSCGAGAGETRCVHMHAVRAAIRAQRTEPRRTANRTAAQGRDSGNVFEISGGPRGPERGDPLRPALDALDRIDPGWSHTVRDIREIGGLLVITVAITAAGTVREGIGRAPAIDHDAFARAEAEAVRSASEKFRAPSAQAPARHDANRVFPSNPIARSLFDLVTAKQLGMIRAMSRELGLDPSEECREMMECSPDELSKRAASAFIGHLLEIRNSRAAAVAWRLAG
jgi:hypothetical protein